MPPILKYGGVSAPPYSSAHSGPVLVCGNAWCLADDLARARKIYPAAPAIAVNGASQHVKAIALYSRHPHRFMAKGFGWIGRQRSRFGDGFTVHGSKHADKYADAMPWVDYWWLDAGGGGGSAWGARKLASLMGFSPVVLCGAPLDPGGYLGNPIAKLMRDIEVIEKMRREIELEPEWHNGVTSVSGWTKSFLGGPE